LQKYQYIEKLLISYCNAFNSGSGTAHTPTIDEIDIKERNEKELNLRLTGMGKTAAQIAEFKKLLYSDVVKAYESLE
jgi:hypothetical protein